MRNRTATETRPQLFLFIYLKHFIKKPPLTKKAFQSSFQNFFLSPIKMHGSLAPAVRVLPQYDFFVCS